MRGARAVWVAGVAGVVVGLFAEAGEYQTVAVSGADVAVTNVQANSQWELRGVLFKWSAPPGTVTVFRASAGVSWLLASAAPVSTNLWWVPDGPLTFRCGDAVGIGCSGGTGTVQVLYGRGE